MEHNHIHLLKPTASLAVRRDLRNHHGDYSQQVLIQTSVLGIKALPMLGKYATEIQPLPPAFLSFYIIPHFDVRVCMHVCIHMSVGSQLTFKNQFSLSTLWIQGIKCKFIRFVQQTFLPAELSQWLPLTELLHMCVQNLYMSRVKVHIGCLYGSQFIEAYILTEHGPCGF